MMDELLLVLGLLFHRRVTVRGRGWRSPTCERCGTEYVFTFSRTVTERAWTRREATRLAEEQLRRVLAGCVEPVPCPVCGHYQEDMCRVLKLGRHGWMMGATVASTLIGLCGVVFGCLASSKEDDFPPWVGPAAFGIGVLAIVAAVAFFRWQRRRQNEYEPNMTPAEDRIAMGRRRAVLRSDLEAKRVVIPTLPDGVIADGPL